MQLSLPKPIIIIHQSNVVSRKPDPKRALNAIWSDDKITLDGLAIVELGLECLKEHFDPQSSQHQEAEYRILIVDGHAIRFCIEKKTYCVFHRLLPIYFNLLMWFRPRRRSIQRRYSAKNGIWRDLGDRQSRLSWGLAYSKRQGHDKGGDSECLAEVRITPVRSRCCTISDPPKGIISSVKQDGNTTDNGFKSIVWLLPRKNERRVVEWLGALRTWIRTATKTLATKGSSTKVRALHCPNCFLLDPGWVLFPCK